MTSNIAEALIERILNQEPSNNKFIQFDQFITKNEHLLIVQFDANTNTLRIDLINKDDQSKIVTLAVFQVNDTFQS